MRALIVSDTHGRACRIKEVLARTGPVDALIHCGDVQGEEEEIARMIKDPVYMVAGNNDFFSDLPGELEFYLEGQKVFLTHGHRYGVAMGVEMLLEEAKSRNVDFVFFGHTHVPFMRSYGEITIANPGSLNYPRQRPRVPSYLLLDLDQTGKKEFRFCYLD